MTLSSRSDSERPPAAQDAKTIYGALADLLDAITCVNREGEDEYMELLDTAMMEAEVVLGAFEGEYAD